MNLLGDLTKREIMAFGLGCLVAIAAFNTGVARARMVPSASMAPTFLTGDRILVRPEAVAAGGVKRGDVLIFKPPFRYVPGESDLSDSWVPGFLAVSDEQTYVKRVVGLPGDTVKVVKGEGVWVNGRPLAEGYVMDRPHYDWGPQRVPDGQLFMLGDNRNNSFDSHYWGFLPVGNVVGRPIAVIWPPRRWRGM